MEVLPLLMEFIVHECEEEYICIDEGVAGSRYMP